MSYQVIINKEVTIAEEHKNLIFSLHIIINNAYYNAWNNSQDCEANDILVLDKTQTHCPKCHEIAIEKCKEILAKSPKRDITILIPNPAPARSDINLGKEVIYFEYEQRRIAQIDFLTGASVIL